MGRIDRVVLWAICGVSLLAVAALALVYANDWWLSGVVTASIVGWLAALLAAMYSHPQRRPLVAGAVIASLLYVTLALGPWFRVQVGPWLLTSQALAYVEAHWLGRQPQPPQQVLSAYPVLTDSGYVSATNYLLTPTSSPAIWTTTAPAASQFVQIGHWLCGWIAALAGAILARWTARRGPVNSRGEDAA